MKEALKILQSKKSLEERELFYPMLNDDNIKELTRDLFVEYLLWERRQLKDQLDDALFEIDRIKNFLVLD